MNNDILAGNWKQFRGNIIERWGKLTEDDLVGVRALRQVIGEWSAAIPAARQPS